MAFEFTKCAAEPLPGLLQPRADGAFRNAQSGCYLAVVIAVIVAQDDRRSQLWRKHAQRPQQVGLRGDLRRVCAVGWSSQATKQLADGSKLCPPPVRDRRVDGDAVDPRLGGSVRAPPSPCLECLHKSILGAVLCFGGISQDGHQRPEYAGVGAAI